MNTETPSEADPVPTIERFHKVYYGVYASEGFGEYCPIAMFRHKDDAIKFLENEPGCDCVMLETTVDGSFDNAS